MINETTNQVPVLTGSTVRTRRRGVLALAAGAVLAAGLTGCAADTAAAGSDRPATTTPTSSATEPGAAHLVTVDGAAVNVLCTGAATAAPPVVLVAGMGDPLTAFGPLQTELAQRTRVCSYDRLGAGTSDPAPDSQTLADAATLLDGVLDAVDLDRDVVVVGHSLGGLVAGQFAHEHQERVAALVLLDATPPSVGPAIEELIPASATGIAADVRAQAGALTSAAANPEHLVHTGGPVGSLGDVPLTVVQHGQPIYDVVPEYGGRLQEIWSTGQREWAGLSTHSRLVTAAHSGHHVHVDEQSLVVELVADAATV